MPARNVVKQYKQDGVYHIYNRGVEKRDIFLDERDYKTFLYYLKLYLSDPGDLKPAEQKVPIIGRANFYNEIELLAYCLMPNHFHLNVKQREIDSMQRFMKCLATNYSMYFNNRYDRVGSLFQGAYKAVLIEEDDYLIHTTRYIHINPVVLKGSHPQKGETLKRLQEYDYSSYADYLGKRNTKWVKPGFILDIFKENSGVGMDKYKSYKSFIENYKEDSREFLGRLSLD